MVDTPKLGIRLMATNDLQKEVIFNEAAVTFDALIARSAINRTNTPPVSPSSGDTYIVSTAPTGAWAGYANNIAFYFNGWHFIAPTQKMKFYNEAVSAFLTYSGVAWTQDAASGSVHTLNDLTDVTIASPTDGQIVQYDAGTSQWKNMPAPAGNLVDLQDVDESELVNDYVLAWDETTGTFKFRADYQSAGVDKLVELTDVNMDAIADGKLLAYDELHNEFVWVVPPTQTVFELNDLNDVAAAHVDLLPNDALVWNGSAWGPSTANINFSFLNMVDGPATFDDKANQVLVCDDTESGLVFKPIGDIVNGSTLRVQDMADTPGPLTAGDVGKYMQVYDAGGSNFRFRYQTIPTWAVSVHNGATQLTSQVTDLKFVNFAVTNTGGNVTVTATNQLIIAWEDTPFTNPTAINFTGPGVTASMDGSGVVTVDITADGGTLETLSDVDLTTAPPTDGQALIFDALSSKWVPGEGASSIPAIDGEAKAALYELGDFAPPTADMFPLRHNAASADLTDVEQHGLVVQPGPQASGIKHSLVTRTLTNNIAPWVVTARVVPSGFAVSGHAGGVALQRASNSAIVFLSLGESSSDTQATMMFGYVNTSGTETVVLSEPNSYNWMRLTFDGNNIIAHVSNDGLIWQQFGSVSATTALGGTPTRVGLDNRSNVAHSGDCGILCTYWDDPDFPASSRTENGIVALAVSNLTDVDVTTAAPTDGQALIWNDTADKWVPGDATGVSALAALTDVDLVTDPPGDGDVLVYDNATSKWVPGTVATPPSTLDALSDVVTTGVTVNQYLKFDGTNWVPATISAGATNLDGLSDVDTSTVAPVSGDLLRFNGTNWVPYKVPANIGFFASGTYANSELVLVHNVADAFYFADDFAGSYGRCEVNPSDGTKTFTVYKNSGAIGTITITTGGTFTFATTGASIESFDAGDVLKIIGPSAADSTLASVSITLKGYRS